MYAHFFKTKTGFEVIVTRSPNLRGMYDERDTGGNFAGKFAVSGKREARKIADEHHAVCWNF